MIVKSAICDSGQPTVETVGRNAGLAASYKQDGMSARVECVCNAPLTIADTEP